MYLKCIAALMCSYPPFPLGCAGMRWHSPYYWILLEHTGNTRNLYDPIRTVLDSPGCALPPVPEMHSCADVQLPPLSYNTFACSGDLWGVPEMHSCTDVQLPPLSYNTLTCSGDLWGVPACVGILPTTGYYWNTLEHIGTTWNLYGPIRTVLDSPGCALPPVPEMHSCTDVQVPPLAYIQYIHMLWGPLGCVGIRWHSPYYWILLEHIGTYWNHLEPIRPYKNRPGFSWMCPAPIT